MSYARKGPDGHAAGGLVELVGTAEMTDDNLLGEVVGGDVLNPGFEFLELLFVG